MQSFPHPKNFCGGNFQDWLEVMLTSACNGKCSWCVEKKGWHPKEHASWRAIGNVALSTYKNNIILLGGEPTLYKDLGQLVKLLRKHHRNVYITTNGHFINYPERSKFIADLGFAGINISIHHFLMLSNRSITGIYIDSSKLRDFISQLKKKFTKVRFNCNLIKGYIDDKESIHFYIDTAKRLGADSVRFAELKDDNKNFVDLFDIFGNEHGINDDPFKLGCQSDTVIDGMPVNFRQMCGIQTDQRPWHDNPVQHKKQVLYYDAKLYDGWQIKRRKEMDYVKLIGILDRFKAGNIDINRAIDLIRECVEVEQKTMGTRTAFVPAEKPPMPVSREQQQDEACGGCVY